MLASSSLAMNLHGASAFLRQPLAQSLIQISTNDLFAIKDSVHSVLCFSELEGAPWSCLPLAWRLWITSLETETASNRSRAMQSLAKSNIEQLQAIVKSAREQNTRQVSHAGCTESTTRQLDRFPGDLPAPVSA